MLVWPRSHLAAWSMQSERKAPGMRAFRATLQISSGQRQEPTNRTNLGLFGVVRAFPRTRRPFATKAPRIAILAAQNNRASPISSKCVNPVPRPSFPAKTRCLCAFGCDLRRGSFEFRSIRSSFVQVSFSFVQFVQTAEKFRSSFVQFVQVSFKFRSVSFNSFKRPKSFVRVSFNSFAPGSGRQCPGATAESCQSAGNGLALPKRTCLHELSRETHEKIPNGPILRQSSGQGWAQPSNREFYQRSAPICTLGMRSVTVGLIPVHLRQFARVSVTGSPTLAMFHSVREIRHAKKTTALQSVNHETFAGKAQIRVCRSKPRGHS
jgi:hypothetical protein